MLVEEALGESAFLKGKRAQGDDEGVGNGQDQQKQVGMLRREDVAGLPLPTVRLEVAEGGFLPVAAGVEVGGDARTVGQQTPGLSVGRFPQDMGNGRQPTSLLEGASGLRPLTTRRV